MLLRNFFVFFIVLCSTVKATDSNLYLIDSLLTEYLTSELAGLKTNGDSIAIRSTLIDADAENYIRFRLVDILHRSVEQVIS